MVQAPTSAALFPHMGCSALAGENSDSLPAGGPSSLPSSFLVALCLWDPRWVFASLVQQRENSFAMSVGIGA